MIKHLVLSLLVALAQANENEDMNLKIKGIAQGIVDKWVKEGLTVTRDKVQGWLEVLDKAQDQGTTTNDDREEFNRVKDTVVKTFTNIGKAKCQNCQEKKENLEDLGVDELVQKQEAIKTYLKMEKLQKLAGGLGDLTDIANLAKNLKTLTTPNEEL